MAGINNSCVEDCSCLKYINNFGGNFLFSETITNFTIHAIYCSRCGPEKIGDSPLSSDSCKFWFESANLSDGKGNVGGIGGVFMYGGEL